MPIIHCSEEEYIGRGVSYARGRQNAEQKGEKDGEPTKTKRE